ncbi:probable RNA-binding protein 18 isoform X3 [Myotis daubentonii]|uniref:probable RNA-binding protein 18 isoform X3 n=1 Tax=Myotis daubentonii TaxID=98922 RepID=UPI0028733307|nr:probable RNA-binding protein 18 isoform X3 [Myotis daubentonii]
MEAETKTLPLENASILSEGSLQEGHRLWIGNLDPKITEYHLLKLLQKFGTVKQFDFLFHKSGALEGQPRGYCFVNFETKQVIGLLPLSRKQNKPSSVSMASWLCLRSWWCDGPMLKSRWSTTESSPLPGLITWKIEMRKITKDFFTQKKIQSHLPGWLSFSHSASH